MQVITLEQATLAGLLRFFTGAPCQNGHISERYAKGDHPCLACVRDRNIRNADSARAIRAAYNEKYKEALRAGFARRYLENREAKIAAAKAFYARDPKAAIARVAEYRKTEAGREVQARYREKNSAKRVAYTKLWAENNPAKARILARVASAKRYAGQKSRCPPWADMAAIRTVYERAARVAADTGIPHEVDHIVPLLGRNVSGLHVHWNLRIITQEANRKKSNKLCLEALAYPPTP